MKKFNQDILSIQHEKQFNLIPELQVSVLGSLHILLFVPNDVEQHLILFEIININSCILAKCKLVFPLSVSPVVPTGWNSCTAAHGQRLAASRNAKLIWQFQPSWESLKKTGWGGGAWSMGPKQAYQWQGGIAFAGALEVPGSF